MSIEVRPVAGSDSFELRLEGTGPEAQAIALEVIQVRSGSPTGKEFHVGDATLNGRIEVKGEQALALAWLGDDRRRALTLLLNGMGGAREWAFCRNQLDGRWRSEGHHRQWDELTGLMDAGYVMLESMEEKKTQAHLLDSLMGSKHGAYMKAVLSELLNNFSNSPETKQAIETAKERTDDLALALLLARPDIIKKQSQRRAILRFGAVKCKSTDLALQAIAMMVEEYGDDRSTAETLLGGLKRRSWKVQLAGIRAVAKTPFTQDAFAKLARVAYGESGSRSRAEAYDIDWLDGNEAAREAFTTLIQTPEIEVKCRYGCLKALVEHFPEHPTTQETLTETAQRDKDPQILGFCATVLMERHIDDPKTAAALEVAAGLPPYAEVRRGFLRSLFWKFEKREETVRAFSNAVVREKDKSVHRYAADVLLNRLPATPGAFAGLRCLAESGETPEIRVNAVIKMGEAGVSLAERQLKDIEVSENLRMKLFEHLVADLPPGVSQEPVCALLKWADYGVYGVDKIGHKGFDAVVGEVSANQSTYVAILANKGGVDWIEVTMEYLDWVDETTQLTIVQQVTQQMPEKAEGWLIERLASDYHSIQLAAVRALAKRGSAQAIGPLRECRKGILVSSDLEKEAKAAEAAIQERVGGVAGGLSLADNDQQRGALTVASEAGSVSVCEDDEKRGPK